MVELTERQQKTIPFIVSGPAYIPGLTEARVSREIFYAWIKIPQFKLFHLTPAIAGKRQKLLMLVK